MGTVCQPRVKWMVDGACLPMGEAGGKNPGFPNGSYPPHAIWLETIGVFGKKFWTEIFTATARRLTMQSYIDLRAGGSANAMAPKEIGLLQRVEGARMGLGEIHGRLTDLSSRIAGAPPTGEAAAMVGPPCGMSGNLSEIEECIRDILSLVNELDRRF